MTTPTETNGIQTVVKRRQILASLGAVAAGSLAGCLGGSSDTAETPAESPANTETAANTQTATHTATSDDNTSTATQTPTATPQDETLTETYGLPLTGEAVPELSVFDETMLAYMDELNIRAGTLGVAKDGEIVLQRGYGYADRAETTPVPPDTRFRIGSISKPITDAALLQLISEDKLARDDRVYPLLDVEPPNGEPADDRFKDITVTQLANHQGGWDVQELGYWPMYSPVRVATERGLDEPPTKYDITRHMFTQPLQFTPGTRESYSNFGYSLLGQVIEGVTGMDYQSYVATELFEPAGITGIALGKTRPQDRPADEIWYDDPEKCSNAFTLDPSEEYTCADKGFLVSEFDSAGGHIASTASLLDYLDAYWLSGKPRGDKKFEYRYFGSHPGSFALARQYPNNVDVVALFNRREIPLKTSKTIEPKLATAVESVDTWPSS